MMIHAFVAAIESPASRDLLDGRTEGRTLCEALKLANIPHSYSLATDREALRIALGDRLRAAARHHGKAPIVHLSMHGNTEGVSLTSGDFLTWDELRIELLPLLRATQGSLLVCMSSCFGDSGCRMAMQEDNEPTFWALVGNTSSTSWADAAVAYISFYHLFFKGFDLLDCVQSMRLASADHNFVYHIGAKTKQKWQKIFCENSEWQIQNAEGNPQS